MDGLDGLKGEEGQKGNDCTYCPNGTESISCFEHRRESYLGSCCSTLQEDPEYLEMVALMAEMDSLVLEDLLAGLDQED